MSDKQEADVLYGVRAISDALGIPVRRAWYLRSLGVLPVFPLYPGSRILCARRETLKAYLVVQEARALPRGPSRALRGRPKVASCR